MHGWPKNLTMANKNDYKWEILKKYIKKMVDDYYIILGYLLKGGQCKFMPHSYLKTLECVWLDEIK